MLKFGNDYHIVMLGEHRSLEIRGIDIDDSSLNGKIDIERRGPGYGNELTYYGVELMELYLGQGDDIVNVQGTSARTDIKSYKEMILFMFPLLPTLVLLMMKSNSLEIWTKFEEL